MKKKLLSKSNYLAGLQCPKLLWIRINAKDLLPELDEKTVQRFERGHKIGELAKKLFPTGIDIPTDDFVKNLGVTKKYIKRNRPLFEPGFMKGYLFSRADILKPNNNGSWDIYEVKSGHIIKEINIHDMSFQKYVYELYGLKIQNCYIIHKNKKATETTQNNPLEYFDIVNVTKRVKNASAGIKERIRSMQKLIATINNPSIQMGKQCKTPFTCQLIPYCENLKKNNLFGHYTK